MGQKQLCQNFLLSTFNNNNNINNNILLRFIRVNNNNKINNYILLKLNQLKIVYLTPQINTTEETFQSDIIDSTIFQTNSFDVLSEFALLVSSTTCSAYSSVLSNESEKMFQQNFQNNLFHLNKFDNDSEFFGQRNCCSADCVAGPAWRDRVHKYCVTILYIGSHQSRP